MDGRGFLAVAAGALLMLSSGARGNFLVDDLEHTGARNYFGGEWGFAGDHYNGGVSKILNADSSHFGTQPSDYRWTFRGSYGQGVEGGNSNAAVMEYRLGTVKPLPAGGNPNVTLWTDFVGFGEPPISLAGSTGLSFYIRASQQTRVEVQLKQNFGKTGWYPSFGKVITANSSWQKVTVLWSEMILPTWAGAPKPVLMDYITKCIGLSWVVDLDANNQPSFQYAGSLLVDSVVILGMNPGPIDKKGFCASCVAAAGAVPPGYPLIGFDNDDALLIERVGDIVKTEGIPNAQSDPSVRATEIESSPVTVGTGFNGSGGAKISYKLGPTVVKDFTQHPSAKMIIPMKKATWDSSISGVGTTGIAFFYKTSFSATRALEVTVASNVKYKASASAYVTIPGTGGEWKLATLPWNKFILPSWSDTGVAPQFPQLSEMLIGYVGSENEEGNISIDNVVILGINSATLVPFNQGPLSNRKGIVKSGMSGINASARAVHGVVSVNIASLETSGVVELLDVRGKLLSRESYLAGSSQVRFPHRLPQGAYLVRVRSSNSKAERVLPITVSR